MAQTTTILIVEDETPLQDVLSDVLSKRGYEIVTASNGKEGLERARETQPDLILLDIIMPVMDGLEMLRTLREDEEGRAIDVVLLTNVSDNEKLAEALEIGAFDYLVKSDHTIDTITEAITAKVGSKMEGKDENE
jgi:CheY-like chemotaxis protein